MKTVPVILLAAAAGAMFTASLSRPASAQASGDQIDHLRLKSLVEGLGYEAKQISAEAGKEKYSFNVKTERFNIPIGAEISPSGYYVWLTVNLGKATEKTKHLDLLKATAVAQPCHFYISPGGFVMLAVAMENRGLSSPVLKRHVDKVMSDVDRHSDAWSQ